MCALLHELVAESAARHPQQVCVVFDSGKGEAADQERRTYSQLWGKVLELKLAFEELSLNEQIVGVLLADGPSIPEILIGLLSSSCAFHPMNQDAAKYTATVLVKAGVSWILAHSELTEKLSQLFNQIDGSQVSSEILAKNGLQLFKINHSSIPSLSPVKQHNLAYCITTSGTTSSPKVVHVPHSCIVPNITDLRNIFQLGINDRVLLTSALTFDPSIVDIFCTLSSGACLVIVPSELKRKPEQLLSILHERQSITMLQATPTLMRSFSPLKLKQTLLGPTSSLRVLTLGGERFPALGDLRSWLHSENKTTQIYNLYGITEVSCWASCQLVDIRTEKEQAEPVTVGAALKETNIKIVPTDSEEGMDDGDGDIWIGSETRICLIDEQIFESDQEKSHAFVGDRADIVWRNTGDRGKCLPDGSIVCLGRRDDQVNRNGKRLNLEVVEMVCKEVEGVLDCCAVLDKSNLFLFIIMAPPIDVQLTQSSDHITAVSSDGEKVSSERSEDDRDTTYLINVTSWVHLQQRLKEHFQESLPFHYAPSMFVKMSQAFPQTQHGKLDKKLLIKIGNAEMKARIGVDISNAWILSLDLWTAFLPDPSVKVLHSGNFISLGGNSLSAVMLMNTLDNILQGSPPNLLDLLINKDFKSFTEELQKYINSKLATSLAASENLSETLVRNNSQTSSLDSCPSEEFEWIEHEKCGSSDLPYNDNSSENDGSFGLGIEKLSLSAGFETVPKKLLFTPALKQIASRGKLWQNQTSSTMKMVLDMNLRWKFDTEKCVDASPLVVEHSDRKLAFIGSHSGQFSAINILTGSPVWSVTLPDRIESSACCSLCGSYVVVGCYDGIIYVFDMMCGTIVWKFTTGDTVKCSPVIDEHTGYVLCGSHDGVLYCLDLNAKECVWKCHMGGGSVFSSPVIDVPARLVYAASLAGSLLCIYANSGKVKWTHNLDKPVFSSLCLLNHSVLIGCVDGKLYSISSSGDIEWTFLTQAPIFSTPTIHDTLIFVGSHDHHVYCLDSTGHQMWAFQASSPVYATPFVSMIVENSTNNSSLCADPEGTTQSPMQQTRTSSGLRGPIVLAASTVGDLYALNVDDGQVLMQVKLPGEVFSSPVMVDNSVTVGCRDNFVYCWEVI